MRDMVAYLPKAIIAIFVCSTTALWWVVGHTATLTPTLRGCRLHQYSIIGYTNIALLVHNKVVCTYLGSNLVPPTLESGIFALSYTHDKVLQPMVVVVIMDYPP